MSNLEPNVQITEFPITGRVVITLDLEASCNWAFMTNSLMKLLEQRPGYEIEAMSQSEYTVVHASSQGTITLKDMTLILRKRVGNGM